MPITTDLSTLAKDFVIRFKDVALSAVVSQILAPDPTRYSVLFVNPNASLVGIWLDRTVTPTTKFQVGGPGNLLVYFPQLPTVPGQAWFAVGAAAITISLIEVLYKPGIIAGKEQVSLEELKAVLSSNPGVPAPLDIAKGSFGNLG